MELLKEPICESEVHKEQSSGRLVYLSNVPQEGKYKMFSSEPDCLTVAQTARLLSVSTQTIRREIAAGRLRAAHVAKRVVITKRALLDYLDEASESEGVC